MKTNYRVWLIVAVFGITLLMAAVNPHRPSYAVGDRVEVKLAPGDDLFAGLRWRNIGPFHGGRIAAVTGAVGQRACSTSERPPAAFGKPRARA